MITQDKVISDGFTATTIKLVDAPDAGENEFGFPNPESQRTYHVIVQTPDKPTVKHAVRITRAEHTSYQYEVQNLVGGKWHRLLLGSLVGDRGFDIPFDAAIERAAKVLS